MPLRAGLPVVVTIHDADLLHRARRAHGGHGDVLPVGDPDRAAPARPGCIVPSQGDPGRADPGARRRPDQASTWPTTASTTACSTGPSDAERRPGLAPARPARHAVRRLPRRARAAQERPGADPRLGRGRSGRDDPPALVLGRRQRLERRGRRGGRRGAGAPAGGAAGLPALHRPARLPRRRAGGGVPEPRRGLRPAGARGHGLRRAGADHAPDRRCPRSAATRSPTPSRTRTRIRAALRGSARRPGAAGGARRRPGYARAQEFTWAASAEAHLASYQRAAAQREE